MIQISSNNIVVIGGTGNHHLDKSIIDWINNTVGTELYFVHIDFDEYPDEEADFRFRKPENIKGKIVIIFASVYNDYLEKELFDLIGASKHQYGALKIIVVLTFMRYRRQDHKDKPGEIDRNWLFLNNLKACGADKLIVCDIHSEITLDNCRDLGIQAYNVSGAQIFADRISPIVDILISDGYKFYIYSPDGGSINRAYNLARILNAPVLLDLKERDHTGEVKIVRDEKRLEEVRKKYNWEIYFADEELVNNAVICMIDDELATGKTARMTGWHLRELGAKYLIYCATHAVCARGWKRMFIDNSPFNMNVFGNTIPRTYRDETGGKITNVFMSKVIAQQLLKVIIWTERELEKIKKYRRPKAKNQ